jgi:hypothetical protein
MAHAVPSQVRELIKSLFPDIEKERAQWGERGLYVATSVRAVLDLLDRIPEELICLSAEDSALYWANISALRGAWEDRNVSANQASLTPLSRSSQRPILQISLYLAQCPDESAAAHTTGLNFIVDGPYRDALRTDISSANTALMNHEYKAATVIGGSVVEALLYYALDKVGEMKVKASAPSAPSKPLNEWTLAPMIGAAHTCNLIGDDTRKQAELAQNFRNLIHPGRQARLQSHCDRGSALGALAAIEMVAVDLAKNMPP